MVFNPIIESLEQEIKFGYKLNEKNFITAPFADDFCLITTNKKTHQRLINLIEKRTLSMGLKLKPSKCVSLSLTAGSPTDIPFKIGNNTLPTLFKEPHKFLGSLITVNNTEKDIYDYIHEKIENALNNIDKSLIRNEYKLRLLFTINALPSYGQ